MRPYYGCVCIYSLLSFYQLSVPLYHQFQRERSVFTFKHCVPNFKRVILSVYCPVLNFVHDVMCVHLTITSNEWIALNVRKIISDCMSWFVFVTTLVHTCCSSVTISSTLFNSKCSGLDNKLSFLYIFIIYLYAKFMRHNLI